MWIAEAVCRHPERPADPRPRVGPSPAERRLAGKAEAQTLHRERMAARRGAARAALEGRALRGNPCVSGAWGVHSSRLLLRWNEATPEREGLRERRAVDAPLAGNFVEVNIDLSF